MNNEENKFKNRVSNNLNRRRIKIISQTPTEIIADIERADIASVEGSKISAETFNEFQTNIVLAVSNSESALAKATSASSYSLEAKEMAEQAVNEAQSAKAITDNIVDTVNNQTINGNKSFTGIVTINGNKVATVNDYSQTINAGVIDASTLYASGYEVTPNQYAKKTDLGTQVTYSLDGTTLTITSK